MTAATKRPRTQHPGTGRADTDAVTRSETHDDYVMGTEGLAAVAPRHGVKVNTARTWANKEAWTLERQVRFLRSLDPSSPLRRRDLDRLENSWKLVLAKVWKSPEYRCGTKEVPGYLAVQLPSELEMEAILAAADLEWWTRLDDGRPLADCHLKAREKAEAAVEKWDRTRGSAALLAAVSLPPEPGLAPVFDLSAYRQARAAGLPGSAA